MAWLEEIQTNTKSWPVSLFYLVAQERKMPEPGMESCPEVTRERCSLHGLRAHPFSSDCPLPELRSLRQQSRGSASLPAPIFPFSHIQTWSSLYTLASNHCPFHRTLSLAQVDLRLLRTQSRELRAHSTATFTVRLETFHGAVVSYKGTYS